MDKLVKLFENLFCAPKVFPFFLPLPSLSLSFSPSLSPSLPPTPQVKEYDPKQVADKLMRKFHVVKRDYAEFLSVKSLYNIPMASYPPLFFFFFFLSKFKAPGNEI